MGYEIFDKLCKKHGVTAYHVAKSTGVSTATLSSWKVGRYTPKADKLQKIADYFGVSVDYLMGSDPAGGQSDGYYKNPETAAVAQEIFENSELRALFDVQKDMDPDDLRALYGMALALKRKERGDDY